MKRKLLLLLLFISFSINTMTINADVGLINDQTLAKELSEVEVDTSLAKGWNKDSSMIFTTIFDSSGDYRGYRTTQVFKEKIDKSLVKDYREDATNVCSIFELNEIEVEYEGETKPAIDFICMQSVGNQGVSDIDGDKITINDNYGITDGYLVGILVYNRDFDKIKGGEEKGGVLYVLDNEGGSAVLVEKEVEATDTKQNTNFTLSKDLIVLGGIGIFALIVIILLIVLIKKIRNKKNIEPQVQQPQNVNPQPNNEPQTPNEVVEKPREVGESQNIVPEVEQESETNTHEETLKEEETTSVKSFEKGEHYESKYGHDTL